MISQKCLNAYVVREIVQLPFSSESRKLYEKIGIISIGHSGGKNQNIYVSFKDFLELSIKYKDNSTFQPHLYFQMSVIERLEKTSISQIWRFKPKLNSLHLV